MNYYEFLEHCINDGIAGAKADYNKESQKDKLDGSIAGFEACRNKTPEQLAGILVVAQVDANHAMLKREENYWYHRCFEIEVAWVCNVVGAMLWAQNKQHDFVVTARGTLRADEILKRAKAELN